MSVNKEKPHLIILAEDDANRQLTYAFLQEIHARMPDPRQVQVLLNRKKDGWKKTVDEKFFEDQVPVMHKYPHQMVLLLIDFDEKTGILNHREYIHQELSNKGLEKLNARVFVLGVWSEPEELKKSEESLGKSYETIGESLAQACINDDDKLWQHELLKHNLEEIRRMKPLVKPLLF